MLRVVIEHLDRTRRSTRLRAGAAMAALMLVTVPYMAAAQETPPAAAGAQKPVAAAAKGQVKPAGQAAPPADGSLRTRVEQLEEQLVDMQVMVGTLESLAKSPTSSGGSAVTPAARVGAGGADDARIDALETQIRALTAQVEQLSQQVKASTGGAGGFAAGPAAGRSEALPPVAGAPQFGAGTRNEPLPPLTDRFGSTTTTAGNPNGGTSTFGGPSSGDAIGGFIERDQSAPLNPQPPAAPSQDVAAFDPAPAASSGDAKQLYETAYGYLLQQDYGAAQASFNDFLQKHPNDSLAGNAQYWLGESHYVKGEYKAAAGAFLKGYQTYAKSAKAPDSLLKLAMSLDKLGQKDAACASYNELSVKFPAAPQHVKNRAQSERQRVGCP